MAEPVHIGGNIILIFTNSFLAIAWVRYASHHELQSGKQVVRDDLGRNVKVIAIYPKANPDGIVSKDLVDFFVAVLTEAAVVHDIFCKLFEPWSRWHLQLSSTEAGHNI